MYAQSRMPHRVHLETSCTSCSAFRSTGPLPYRIDIGIGASLVV